MIISINSEELIKAMGTGIRITRWADNSTKKDCNDFLQDHDRKFSAFATETSKHDDQPILLFDSDDQTEVEEILNNAEIVQKYEEVCYFADTGVIPLCIREEFADAMKRNRCDQLEGTSDSHYLCFLPDVAKCIGEAVERSLSSVAV